MGFAVCAAIGGMGCDCGGGGDGSPMDSGGGERDGGPMPEDAGPGDAGPADAGPEDSGPRPVDAGPPDAGVEPMCSEAMPCSWRMATPADSPPVLAWAAMAYDIARDRMILFGGAPTIFGGTLTDRTWSWDGTTWTELFPTRRPSPRWTHGMAYDIARERIVLFGGQSTDAPGGGLADTWEWDGTEWNEITTTRAPSPRGVHGAMTYDARREVIVLRGGGTLPGQPLFADTWEYDGTNWTEIPGAGPSERVGAAMVYDAAGERVLLFGGGTWSPYYDDMWSWDGTTWTDVTPMMRPTPRQSARAIFDPTRSLVVLFGGDDGSLRNDLWEWDGTSWTMLPVAGPPPRCCYAYAHDLRRSQTVLFGGSDDQTWVYGR